MRGTHQMRKRALPLLVALAALTLPGCHSDPESAPPPTTPPTTPSTNPTPSTSPKPPPPTIPPAATAGLTVTSAEAFARFYLAATDHLVATGDGTLVRRWALPGCVACRAFADEYEKTYRSGGAITGSTQTQVTKVSSVELAGKDRAKVVLNTKIGPSVMRASATASPETLSGGNERWEFYLSSKAGHWLIFELKLTE